MLSHVWHVDAPLDHFRALTGFTLTIELDNDDDDDE